MAKTGLKRSWLLGCVLFVGLMTPFPLPAVDQDCVADPCDTGCPSHPCCSDPVEACCGSPDFCGMTLDVATPGTMLYSPFEIGTGYAAINYGLDAGFGSPELPPASLDPVNSSMPLISSPGAHYGSATPIAEMASHKRIVDLVFGHPLIQEIDFSLPFGSAVFRQSDELTVANATFERGDYAAARRQYRELASIRPSLANDISFSIALCYFREGNLTKAAENVRRATPRSLDDRCFAAMVLSKADDPSGVLKAMEGVTTSELSIEPTLLEQLARAAARESDEQSVWHYYSLLEENYPTSENLQRLQALEEFDFTDDFFGYGLDDLKNYSKGFGSGALANVVDTAHSVWQLVRHPIRTIGDVANAVFRICTRENLKLLLSPRRLTSALGDSASRLYWNAWNACRASAARQYNLDPDKWEHQRPIHEIAAGRMFGYVAPDLALVLIPVVKGSKTAVDSAKLARASENIGDRVSEINKIGRSEEFLRELKRFRQLDDVPWPTLEDSWRAFKAHPKWANHLDDIADWIHAIRDIPGAETLVKLAAGRLHLDDGYLFQLARAAEYAKSRELEAIGRRFHVDVALPGKPVKTILGDADLVLNDGTLVETKLRSGSLGLSEISEQLLKYNKAVKDGKFSGVRIECSGRVDQKVYERASELTAQGTRVEIVEQIPWSVGSLGG